MTPVPRILLVDDGELDDLASILDHLEIEHTRLRGGFIGEDLTPPTELLVATPRRAEAVRRGSPEDAAPGCPLRIIAADEDSNAMRRMLKRLGFRLLVRRGAHPEVWRLLVERALFQGEDRRTDARLPVGSAVSYQSKEEGGSDDRPSGGLQGWTQQAMLVDISNRGCRLTTPTLLEPGSSISLEVPLDDYAGEVLRVQGRLVRSSMEPSAAGGRRYLAAVLFSADVAEVERVRLARLINDLSVGPGSLTNTSADPEPLPACASPVVPGLTLDAETDPAVAANVEVAVTHRATPSPSSMEDDDRRRSPRGSFQKQVFALSDQDERPRHHVLMGRDLSAGGMRIEHVAGLSVGDQFRIAIYGPESQEPFRVKAEVHRDDSEGGLALHFVDVPKKTAHALEKLVACLPDIESLEEEEGERLGAIISEIVSDIDSSR